MCTASASATVAAEAGVTGCAPASREVSKLETLTHKRFLYQALVTSCLPLAALSRSRSRARSRSSVLLALSRSLSSVLPLTPNTFGAAVQRGPLRPLRVVHRPLGPRAQLRKKRWGVEGLCIHTDLTGDSPVHVRCHTTSGFFICGIPTGSSGIIGDLGQTQVARLKVRL